MIPVINFIAALILGIWFGIKGNEWAWRNKKFAGVKAFHEHQKKWALWGIIIAIISIILIPIIIILGLGLGQQQQFGQINQFNNQSLQNTNFHMSNSKGTNTSRVKYNPETGGYTVKKTSSSKNRNNNNNNNDNKIFSYNVSTRPN